MSSLRRLWPQRVRTRLTLLYVVLFLIAGSSLLALTYGLLASRLPNVGKVRVAPSPGLLQVCKEAAQLHRVGKEPAPTAKLPNGLVEKCKQAFTAGARAGAQNQRDATLNTLLTVSLIGLGVTLLASAGLGWLLAGRALRPVRAITESARRASELQLGERLALDGPEDELKELADTFDEMLERLDAAFASQKRFVANAAHELRTPLTAMRTAIEVTLSKPERTPDQLEAMALKVRGSVERAEATIEALLTLATSERGLVEREPVDLATATEDALDAAATSIAATGLSIEADLEPAPTSGDSVLLERMVANLVDNAVRHNIRDGWVRVRTRSADGAAVFEVANSGPQVPDDAVPGLVEPFARAAQRLNPLDGVGLGLSIASAIVAAHGSELVISSRAEGGLDVSLVLRPTE